MAIPGWFPTIDVANAITNEHYGVSFVPPKWSNSLASSAQRYAETLARTGQDLVHGKIGVRENLAVNKGTAPSADSVLTYLLD